MLRVSPPVDFALFSSELVLSESSKKARIPPIFCPIHCLLLLDFGMDPACPVILFLSCTSCFISSATGPSLFSLVDPIRFSSVLELSEPYKKLRVLLTFWLIHCFLSLDFSMDSPCSVIHSLSCIPRF